MAYLDTIVIKIFIAFLAISIIILSFWLGNKD